MGKELRGNREEKTLSEKLQRNFQNRHSVSKV